MGNGPAESIQNGSLSVPRTIGNHREFSGVVGNCLNYMDLMNTEARYDWETVGYTALCSKPLLLEYDNPFSGYQPTSIDGLHCGF